MGNGPCDTALTARYPGIGDRTLSRSDVSPRAKFASEKMENLIQCQQKFSKHSAIAEEVIRREPAHNRHASYADDVRAFTVEAKQ